METMEAGLLARSFVPPQPIGELYHDAGGDHFQARRPQRTIRRLVKTTRSAGPHPSMAA